MPKINWRYQEEFGCLREGYYIIEVDNGCIANEKIDTDVLLVYYVKAGDVFTDLPKYYGDNDGTIYNRCDVIRLVEFTPLTMADIFGEIEQSNPNNNSPRKDE
jgi:hypothetical protein